jgi:Ca2+-binding RTX toxin-like protein
MTDAISAILAAQAAALRQTVVTIDASVVPAGTASTTAIRKGTTKSDHFLGSKTKADRFDGGDGDDAIFGYGGNDELYGGNGNDVIDGGTGNDKLYGGTGNDAILGEAGNDQAYGGSGNDIISGGEGNDTLFGESGNDNLVGGKGNDRLDGGSGRNVLDGGEGNDTLVAARDGNGTLDGGAGDDTFLVLGVDYNIIGGAGTNTIDLSGLVSQQFIGGVGIGIDTDNGRITGMKGPGIVFFEIEKFIGSIGNDSINVSGDIKNSYYGGKGNDVFRIDGSYCDVEGDEGNDTYVVSADRGGEFYIKYETGHDTLVIDKYKTDASLKYSVKEKGADLIVNYKATDLLAATITVEGGAAAYRDGRFGIAEAQHKAFPDIAPSYTTVGGAVNLSGGNSMVGGRMNDTLSIFSAEGMPAYDSHVTMTGGGGADTFVLGANRGSITIQDYNLLQGDRIKFDDTTGIKNFDTLRMMMIDQDEGFRFLMEDQDRALTDVLLKGVDLQELEQAYDRGLLLF